MLHPDLSGSVFMLRSFEADTPSGKAYKLELFDLRNQQVAMEQVFHDWTSYSRAYDSARTMLQFRESLRQG